MKESAMAITPMIAPAHPRKERITARIPIARAATDQASVLGFPFVVTIV